MTSATAKPTAKPKAKEKVLHPGSRKAGQIIRSQLRKTKLASATSKRGRKYETQADIYGFFFHAVSDEEVSVTLEELHSLVRDIWLTRHDSDLEAERLARRKGRPKSVKESQLEEIKLRETEEYRTGLEVPDLTHPANVRLFRRWDQKELAFIQLLRFIRIFRDDPEVAVLTRPGKHYSLLETPSLEDQPTTEWIPPEAPPQHFTSAMMAVDGSI